MGETAAGVEQGKFLAPEEVGRTEYRVVPGGVQVPPRHSNEGRSPAFNPARMLEGIPVNLFEDGNQVAALKPGEADAYGNPKSKDAPCPPNSLPSPTTATPASPSRAPEPSPSPSSSALSQPLAPPGSGTSTTTKTKLPGRPQKLSAAPEEIATSILQQLSPPLLSLQSGLDSLTKSITELQSRASTPQPSSASGSPRTSWSSPSPRVSLMSELGAITFEALEVSTANEGLVVLVVDPQKPHMAPKAGEVLVTVDDRKQYHCRAHDLLLKLEVMGQDVLVIVLTLLEDLTPAE